MKYLFPVPKDESKRVVTFFNWDDWILFRHHTYKKTDGGKNYELEEAGPRFSMKCKYINISIIFLTLKQWAQFYSYMIILTLLMPLFRGLRA